MSLPDPHLRCDGGVRDFATAHWSVVVQAQDAFSPDGRTMASCGIGGIVKLWHVLSRREVATLIRGAADFSCVAFTPDGNTLLAGSRAGLVHLWRAPTLTRINRPL